MKEGNMLDNFTNHHYKLCQIIKETDFNLLWAIIQDKTISICTMMVSVQAQIIKETAFNLLRGRVMLICTMMVLVQADGAQAITESK